MWIALGIVIIIILFVALLFYPNDNIAGGIITVLIAVWLIVIGYQWGCYL